MKTFSAKGHEVQRDWFVVDATDKILGRVASEVALRLRGKHKRSATSLATRPRILSVASTTNQSR